MAKLKCTGLNCPVQYTYADPKKCAEPEKCPYATFPQTNADRIRAMTDEKLAEFLAKRYTLCARCFFRRTCSKDPIGVCLECCLAWLRSPAESEGEE